MEMVQIFDLAKVALTTAVLLAAAVSDLRTRRVPDRTWVILGAVCAPLLFLEMGELGGWDDPISFLSLFALASGVIFVLYGYPEPKEIAKGNGTDIAFAGFYLASVVFFVASFALGNKALVGKVGLSLIFMIVYYLMYTVPIAGTRLLHGGADAKCLILLAAVFPWQVEGLFFNMGPFYEVVKEVPPVELVFNPHLSTLLNGAVMTGGLLLIYMPVRNFIKGDLAFPSMFTSYMMDVKDLRGSHVWIITEEHGRRTKHDPDEAVVRRLERSRTKRVWVSPKIPFILSLALAFIVHMTVGNLVLLLLL